KFSRQPETLMPGATSLDLLEQELLPARLNPGQRSHRRALHLRDGLADLAENALFLILRQVRPRLRAQDAVHTRDDEIGPSVALAFEHDFRDRHANTPAKLRQRNQLRD